MKGTERAAAGGSAEPHMMRLRLVESEVTVEKH